MGCRCLLGAFEVLANGRKKVLESVDQTILAAADIDVGMMPHLGKYAVNFPTRSTSYISDQDKALMVSGWLHDFERVGVTPPTFVLKGLDTVLVNDMDLNNFISHDYVATSRDVLNDIFSLIKDNKPPSERFSVEAVVEGAKTYWKIKR